MDFDVVGAYGKRVVTSSVSHIGPAIICSAKGATITDSMGREYVDCFAGIPVVNSGHCNPRVVQVAKDQLDKLVHACAYVYYIEPFARLADKPSAMVPAGLKRSKLGWNSLESSLEGMN